MQQAKLKAIKRDLKGKKFRDNNPDNVPGVVYGKAQEATSIAVDAVEFSKLYNAAGTSSIVDLEIEGEKTPVKVLIHDVDVDAAKNQVRHFDLYAVTLGEKLKTDVPIHFEGESPATVSGEAMLTTIKDTVEIEANPLELPDNLVLDISSLKEIGDALHVSDLKPGSKVEILDDPEEIVVKLDAIREEEEEPEEVEGVEEAEEGAAEGETSAEGEEAGSDEAEEGNKEA